MWLVNVMPMIFQAFASMIINPIFWIVIVLVVMQYRRIARMQEALNGKPGENALQMTAVSIIYGVIGGLVGSIAMVTIGISLDNIALEYLWPLAMILMLLNIRFLCFAYAGGIIAISYLLFGFPKVDVAQLMALVGLLHLVEAVLIYLNGHHDAIPVYTRIANGQVVGGYTLQKFWPIPIVALMTTILPNPDYIQSGIHMPDWWPLLKNGLESAKDNVQYLILPVAAALGYGDIAITSLPKEKSKKSAFYLFLFSITLLCLSVGASRYMIFAWAAALFSPLGHELVIKLGRDMELKGKPLFQALAEGIRVFDVLSNSPAEKAGINRGDLILKANGLAVNSKEDFTNVLIDTPWLVEIEYLPYGNNQGKSIEVRKTIAEELGIVFPPEPWDNANVDIGSGSLLKKFFNKIVK